MGQRLKHFKFEDAAIVLAGSKAAREYLEPIFSERDRELTVVAFCDAQLRLAQLLSFPGSRESVQISLVNIVRRALGCAGLVMAHNHPSGDPNPSQADLRLARRLLVITESIEVTLLDNLIFAGGRMFSFRQAGLI